MTDVMEFTDTIEGLDLDAVVPCEVKYSKTGVKCGNPADIAVFGQCPACGSKKPRRNLMCWQPHWIKLRDLMLVCHSCGHTAPFKDFYTIVHWL